MIMSRPFLFLMCTAVCAIPQLLLSQGQVSLFDADGEAVAFIDYEEDATIYLWDGTPVAYLERDGSDLCIFGFNRTFLGWYENGIVYDAEGYTAGSRENALNMFYRMERFRGFAQLAPLRPIAPFWKNRWSNTPLVEFLYAGKE
jgi:hypothetical protein